ncbi:hypothetical protein [Brachyspira sp. G79]|uniref:hypothetical protein n=1 Tax=Brachyspira sp. G79 TaxID=1358104 RepID=UPI000BBBA239|nr:hypothetical protein [Brachyspira sp. G79]PCG20728.1 hypothetical protein KQ44_12620 [Brachyspira sp. G79]
MKTVLKTIIITMIICTLVSCSKQNYGIDSKYAGTYKGNAKVQTSSATIECEGVFTVNSDGSVKGNIYNNIKTYEKTYDVSKNSVTKENDNTYKASENMLGYKVDFIFIFNSDTLTIEITDYNEGSIVKGNFSKFI